MFTWFFICNLLKPFRFHNNRLTKDKSYYQPYHFSLDFEDTHGFDRFTSLYTQFMPWNHFHISVESSKFCDKRNQFIVLTTFWLVLRPNGGGLGERASKQVWTFKIFEWVSSIQNVELERASLSTQILERARRVLFIILVCLSQWRQTFFQAYVAQSVWKSIADPTEWSFIIFKNQNRINFW